MAKSELNGAGQVKMAVVEEANDLVARLHSNVEKMALAQKQGQNTGIFQTQIRRILEQLISKLKAQFGAVADQVTSVNLASSRGPEPSRLRALREGVAQIRQAMEIAERKVREQHAVTDEETRV